MKIRLGAALGALVVYVAASACSSHPPEGTKVKDGTPIGQGGSGGFAGSGGGSIVCVAGQSCSCGPDRPGVTSCAAGFELCDCPVCPALELSEAPRVTPCGGDPFGIWRLTRMDLGWSELSLSRTDEFGNITNLGTCAAMVVSTATAVPKLLIDIQDGGISEIYAEPVPVMVSWSDSCVTSRLPELVCSASVWSNTTSCSVDCDVCSCASALAGAESDAATWSRTATTLSLTLGGEPAIYDYCVSGNTLSLSADGEAFELERVYTLPQPKPCSELTAADCALVETCSVGACVGGTQCTPYPTEGSCLTVQGCSWDPNRCQGSGQLGCRLSDFGVVPGCDFVDQPYGCVGTSTPCSDRTRTACEQDPGCSLSEIGRCTGETAVDCGLFSACPIGYCSHDSQTFPYCFGTTSCSLRGSEDYCYDMNDGLGYPACSWMDFTCQGTATACDRYGFAECAQVPGCSIQPLQ